MPKEKKVKSCKNKNASEIKETKELKVGKVKAEAYFCEDCDGYHLIAKNGPMIINK